MNRNLATIAICVFFVSGCGDNSEDDGSLTGGTGVAGIPTSGAGVGDQAGASGSEGGVSGGESKETLCPGGAATETLILVETIEELAALSDCTSLNGLGILVSENTTLDALNKVTTIAGSLSIEDCGVSSLQGLSNLTSVGGDLIIKNCSSLANLDGLENLKTIGGRLTIRDNVALSDVKGLSSLQSISVGVGKGLMFRNNPSLPTCAAEEVATNLAIEDEALIIICGGMSDACGLVDCQPET